ncbi:CBS domain-containing protein [Flavobacterium sediminilitoris]|uniref:CBS domain-containing protein n=1 Tax=Flavobacterium sediminilitoris TaxID=2024526 RepID=A0ABY4HUP5_9FLAO|nr:MULTISPECIES: CBS domain-containing protein [Flavobacterium]UOX35434.1 CBS domain-containing protein [Flavobacterium sediminilitoris]
MNSLIDFLNNDIKPLKSEEKIIDAQELFSEFPYTHFPVTEDSIYIGCITKDDSETLSSNASIGDNRHDFKRFYVRSEMIWLDVLEEFAKNETNILPVLNDQNKYIGYYELEDVIKFFHETPFLKETGNLLIIRKEANNFSMSQIAQIVESNNAKLLGLFISKIDNNFIEFTLKINLGGLNDIIQTFRRYEYEIISEHQEDTYLKNLKDRSDYLDKYLNI